MNGAKLRLIRMTLGISSQEMAERLDVLRHNLKAWENDRKPIPAGIADQVQAMWDLRLEKANFMLEELDQMVAEQHEEPDEVALTIFRSGASNHRANPGMTWAEHTAEVGLLAFLLEAEGFNVSVNYSAEED